MVAVLASQSLKVVAGPGLDPARLGPRSPEAEIAALSRNTHDKVLPARRDQSESHRLLALIAVWSEEHIGPSAVGTWLDDQRKGR